MHRLMIILGMILPSSVLAEAWVEITQDIEPYQTTLYYTTSSATAFNSDRNETTIWGAVVQVLHEADGEHVATVSKQKWRINCDRQTIASERRYDFNAEGIPIIQRYRYLHQVPKSKPHAPKSERQLTSYWSNDFEKQSRYGTNRYFSKSGGTQADSEKQVIAYICQPNIIKRGKNADRSIESLIGMLKQKYSSANAF